jgi:hypothetical protein
MNASGYMGQSFSIGYGALRVAYIYCDSVGFRCVPYCQNGFTLNAYEVNTGALRIGADNEGNQWCQDNDLFHYNLTRGFSYKKVFGFVYTSIPSFTTSEYFTITNDTIYGASVSYNGTAKKYTANNASSINVHVELQVTPVQADGIFFGFTIYNGTSIVNWNSPSTYFPNHADAYTNYTTYSTAKNIDTIITLDMSTCPTYTDIVLWVMIGSSTSNKYSFFKDSLNCGSLIFDKNTRLMGVPNSPLDVQGQTQEFPQTYNSQGRGTVDNSAETKTDNTANTSVVSANSFWLTPKGWLEITNNTSGIRYSNGYNMYDVKTTQTYILKK